MGSGLQRAGDGLEGKEAEPVGLLRGRGGSLEGKDGVSRAGGGDLRRNSDPELSSVLCGWWVWGFCQLQVLSHWS